MRAVLKVNESRQATLAAGDPLWLSVTLQPAAEDALTLGAELGPWPSAISFEVRREQWEPLDWPLILLSASPPGPDLVVDWQTPVRAEFGLDPEAVARLPAGDYAVRAVLRIRADDPAAQVESNPVTLTLTGRPEPTSTEERMLLTARYFLARGRPERAREVATEALAANAASVGSLIALGEAEDAAGNFPAALTYFHRAVEAFAAQNPDPNEQPRYLMRKIVETTDKIARGGGR